MNLEELALLLGLTNEELVAKAEELNIDLSSIADELDEELIGQLKERLNIELPESDITLSEDDLADEAAPSGDATDLPSAEQVEESDALGKELPETPDEPEVVTDTDVPGEGFGIDDTAMDDALTNALFAKEEVPKTDDLSTDASVDEATVAEDAQGMVDSKGLADEITEEELLGADGVVSETSEETESEGDKTSASTEEESATAHSDAPAEGFGVDDVGMDSSVSDALFAKEEPSVSAEIPVEENLAAASGAADEIEEVVPETPEDSTDVSVEDELGGDVEGEISAEEPVVEEALTEESVAEESVVDEPSEKPTEALTDEVLSADVPVEEPVVDEVSTEESVADSVSEDAPEMPTEAIADEALPEETLERPTETFEVPLDEAPADEEPIDEALAGIPQGGQAVPDLPLDRELTPEEIDAMASEVREEEKMALGSADAPEEGAATPEEGVDLPPVEELPVEAESETEPEVAPEETGKGKGKKKDKKKKEKGEKGAKGNPLLGVTSFFGDFFVPIFTTPAHRNILILGAVLSAVMALTFSSLFKPDVTVEEALTPEEIEAAKKKELPPVQIRGGFRGERDLFQLIWELHLQGYYNQAYDYAQRFIEEHRDSDLVGDVYYKMGDILYDWDRGSKTKQYKEARAAYEKAIKYMPDDAKVPWGQFQLANTYFFLNVYDAAIDYYRDLIENHQTYQYLDIAQSRLALSFLKSHQYERAELEYKRLIELYPNSSLIRNAHFKMAEIHYRKKDLKKSITAYKAYLHKYPHSPKKVEVFFRMAKLYKYLKSYDQSITYFKKSIAKYPNDIYNELATFEIAENYLLLKEYDSARTFFTEVIETYPKHQLAQTAYHRIGDTYLYEGKEDEAIEVYEKALTSFPDLHASRLSEVKLADLYFQRGDFDQAISIFSDILVNDPNYYANDRVVFRIAQSQYRKGNYLEATDWYLRLIREFPSSLLVKKAYFDKAQAEVASNFYERAINSYLEFLKKFPDHPHVDLISYMVGDMKFRLGKYMEAITYWEDMRANYPLSDYRYKALNDIGRTYLKMAGSPEYFDILRDDYGVKGEDDEIINGLKLKAQETFLQLIGNKALEGTEEFFSAGKELSNFYYKDKEYDKALMQIDALLTQYASHKENYVLLNLKATIFFELNLIDETVSAYEDLISLLTFRLSEGEEKEGLVDDAEKEEYEILIAEAYFTLGDLFFSQDKISESLYLYLEGLRKLPENEKRGWPLYQVANCYNELNNYDKANYYYDQLKKDFPDDFWSEYVGWNKERMQWKKNMTANGDEAKK